jgi:ribosome biogenesis SPOUT family RNA methylase Rps3
MAVTKLYVVEHLDPELGPWSKLEYLSIAEESNAAGSRFCLSSVSPSLDLPRELHGVPGLRMETEGVETFLANEKERVCLLDPSAEKDLSPEDGALFDVFLFGGILGTLSKFLPLCLVHADS